MPNNISELKTVKCNICGSDNYRIIGEKNSYQVINCIKCGLVYINPQPTSNITSEIYNEQYFSGGCNFGYQGIDYLSKENENWFKYLPTKALLKIERLQPNKGKILDIGCAVGYFLEVARGRNWEIHGVEISEFAADLAEKRLKIKIFPTLDQTDFPANHFDSITAFEIIEHLQDPSEFLQKINKLLKDKGVLGLSTPNLKNSKSLKNFLDWNYLTPPEHLHYFDKNTITEILKKNGFEVVYIFWGPINPLNKLSGKGVSSVKNLYHKLKPVLGPVKRIIFDLPMAWYGEKSGLGEDMIVIAKKK